jgi:hypothetical protein
MAEPALKPLTFDELEALEDRDGLRYELWNGSDSEHVKNKC